MSKYCKNCGALLNDEAKFCSKCGTKQDGMTMGTSWESGAAGEYRGNAYSDMYGNNGGYAKGSKPTSEGVVILIMGILSVLFSESVLFGLIFGIVGRVTAKKTLEAGIELTGTGKAGNILSIVGIVLSGLLLFLWIALLALGVIGSVL